MAEVLSRNTRHDAFRLCRAFVVAVYCYTHALRTYLCQEPLAHFSKAGPANTNFPCGKHFGATVAHEHNFRGMATGFIEIS